MSERGGQGAVGRIDRETLRELIHTGQVDTVIPAIVDMQGRLMGKRFTGQHFADHVMEHGSHFCNYLLGTEMEMGCPSGYRFMSWEQGYGDWLAVPDWQTLRVVPWLDRTALVLCDAEMEGQGAVPVAPRQVLRRQVERAAQMGFSLKMASELEFYLLRDTYEGARQKQFHGLQPFGWYNEDYHLLQGTKAEPLYRQLRNLMTAAGIPIECSKGEAAPGQHEVNLHYADALEAADRHALFKHGVKEIALQNGLAVTFMAKPDHTWTGSSSHLHVSLWDREGTRNLFPDPQGHGMSDLMRWFLGGMMACARELSVFVAPNVNSYKRYAALSWAPVHIVWARDNRTCGFRVVGHGNGLRIENRFPGGDTNPYLAYAAIIGAGLYGIEHRIEPPAEYRGNGYLAQGAPRVPRSLWEAILTLEQSTAARHIFGEEVVAHYLQMARVEQEIYDGVVTCWERERYLERG